MRIFSLIWPAVLTLLVVFLAGAVLVLIRRLSRFEAAMDDVRHRLYEDFPWYDIGRPYPGLRRLLNDMITSAERGTGVRLSPAAREMLIIPVAEQYSLRQEVPLEVVERSIVTIVSTIAEESVERFAPLPLQRPTSSVSVIRAFWRRFCNIPPFCSPTESTG